MPTLPLYEITDDAHLSCSWFPLEELEVNCESQPPRSMDVFLNDASLRYSSCPPGFCGPGRIHLSVGSLQSHNVQSFAVSEHCRSYIIWVSAFRVSSACSAPALTHCHPPLPSCVFFSQIFLVIYTTTEQIRRIGRTTSRGS